jgi:phosphatidylserine decarboxylase
MKIHKEGYTSLLIVTLVLGAINAALMYFLPEMELLQNIVLFGSIILFGLVLQFFRNPHVQVTQNEQQIIAPADGKVVVIEDAEENEYFKDKRKQISIFMSPINVHVNRNPISGVVKYFKYHPGLFLVAWHPKSSTENERTTVVIQNKAGKEVLFRQVAGAVARRICWYVKETQIVQQGEEFGFIKFGSRVDLYLPLDAKINVEIGQKTKGGQTVLATF